MFADRDGKFQLGSLAESAFDPLARTCRFMLTEEAHHLSVGETGLNRVINRSAELTSSTPTRMRALKVASTCRPFRSGSTTGIRTA